MAAEPGRESTATTLKVRLPSGRAVVRRFTADATAADVFSWLQSLDELADVNWTLVPPIGSDIEGELLPTDETLCELGFAPHALLNIRDDDA